MEEQIGDLPADTAIDRVFTDEETRLYRCAAMVSCDTYLDPEFCKIRWLNPVEVLDEGGKRIGFSSLSEADSLAPPAEGPIVGDVIANIALVYATPERLTLQARFTALYAEAVLKPIPHRLTSIEIVALRITSKRPTHVPHRPFIESLP